MHCLSWLLATFACAVVAIGSGISTPWCSASGAPRVLIQLPPVILFLPILACLYPFLLQSLFVSYSWAQRLLMLPGEQRCGVIQRASLSDFLVREELLELRGRLLRLLSTDLWSVDDGGVG